MSRSDDAERLRIRDETIASRLSRRTEPTTSAAPCLVARTTKINAYPTLARSHYACDPVAVLGVETEGGAADLVALAAPFLAINLGGAVPPEGTDVVAAFIGDRWVFRYG